MTSCAIRSAVAGLVLAALAPAANASIVAITAGDLLSDATTLDFTGAATGPIAGNAALFTGAGYSNVYIVGSLPVGAFNGDTWNSGTDGNGLTTVGGQLAVVAVNQTFDNGATGVGFGFDVAGTATQLGFQIIDQAGIGMRLQTFANNVLLDTLNFTESNSFPNPQRYYSSTAFDRWELTCTSGCGGWGLDNIVLAGRATVPEPATALLLGAGLLGGIGFRRARRRTG